MTRKTKRVSLHQKYKVERKVREHNKKQRREAKKNPDKRQSSLEMKKDPGIPNLWPLKEQLMDQIEANKQRALQDKKDRKTSQSQQLQDLVDRANQQASAFEQRLDEVDRADLSYVDTSRRSFFREFLKVVKASDVILEVLDARDPLGTRCPSVEQQILSMDPNKKIVLVLNKIDLVPQSNVQSWLKHLRGEYPTIAFKSSTTEQRMRSGAHKKAPAHTANDLNTTECLGATTLLGLLKNYARSVSGDVKKSITVGIIGLPNVGKSSLINSLKRAKAVSVGSTPGLTRTAQQIQLDKNIALYDCPGIIFTSSSSQAEAALRNAVRIEQIADPVGPVELVLQKCTKELLASVYKIAMFSSTAEFLTNVAQKRGKLQRGGAVSLEGAARLILKDWTEGKIPYLSTPPARQNVHVEASVVPDWGKDFNIQEIERLEAEHVFSNLNAVDESEFIQIASEVAAPDGTYANISAPLQAIAYSYSESDSDEEESGEDVDMEEDGEESGEEDDDAMVDTVPAEPEPQSTLAPSKSAKQKLGTTADMYNPQINKVKRDAMKKNKQKEKKRKRNLEGNDSDSGAAEKDGEDMDEDQNFDFGVDFWSNVSPKQVVNTSNQVTPPSKKQQKRKEEVDEWNM